MPQPGALRVVNVTSMPLIALSNQALFMDIALAVFSVHNDSFTELIVSSYNVTSGTTDVVAAHLL